MKIDRRDLVLPIELGETLYYADNEIQEVVEVNVREFHITGGCILIYCFVANKPYKYKKKRVSITFNLECEQPLFKTECEALECLVNKI
ncbi:hypothetical protein [Cellulosilyticum sp. WCF-2]|uniref:hypothetical protein n=1 Tax=Cellulosilyticum sp. WCF-2 TaxID=2497860 RepID=UPI000F8C79EB|nr:hypothetical protein [Cellulosilyticum sp. WCF-2]QEH67286.1 hypothetical protein EKH84_02075 [Cellulosilyticum sp. WCF-2]QEH68201.1 hypothetical protein EKH84_07290 [Cellulosilyticum sp. WCF-2]